MARYRNDLEEERGYDPRRERERYQREGLGSFDEPYRQRFEADRRPDFSRGRFGERAEYDYDEPRYSEQRERFRDDWRRSSLYDVRGDITGRREPYREYRSRLRCRDIMTRDLAVATRDTTLTEIAMMMKQEDTGVIPVVEYDTQGDARSSADAKATQDTRNTYSRGRLVGLITDRDIVIRAAAEKKDPGAIRAEEIMTTDLVTAKPNDRVVDVIRKMGDKQVRRIPVCNDNHYLVGMISMADIALETSEDRELGDALEEISKSTSFWNRIFG